MTTDSSASRRAWRFALAGTLLAGFGLGSALAGVARAEGPLLPKTEKQGSVPPIKEPIKPKTEQKASVPEPATSHSMWCRGPLSLEAGNTVVVAGARATTAAGQSGERLGPGECALEARALRQAEPRRVRFAFVAADHRYETAMMPALAVCALDPDCVVRIGVGVQPVNGWWNAVRNMRISTARHRG